MINFQQEGSYFDANATLRSQHDDNESVTSEQSYQKEAMQESQYSTNHTHMKNQLVIEDLGEEMEAQSKFNFTRPLDSELRSPINRAREGVRDYSRSPIGTRRIQMPTSPLYSPYSQKSQVQLSEFPQLEQHGITLDDFKKERSINSEMLKIAKNQLEILKMLKNSISLVTREIPGAYNILSQSKFKAESLTLEVQESKRKIRENHSINI